VRERDLSERENHAERTAREEARRILMDARAEVEQAIAEGRSAAGDAEAERLARRRVEEAARHHRESARAGFRGKSDRRGGRSGEDPFGASGMAPGTRVKVASGAAGTVVDLEGETATVELDGGVRMRMPLGALKISGEASPNRKGTVHWTVTATGASTEVDLRGLRVGEVEAPLLGAVDRAVLADLPSLRIIHGKGTGAVKARVLELIGDDPRVLEYVPGGEGEGGSGVTVVRLR